MRVLGNGLRTDHPIPGLPFVDDSHIPIEDPRAVEAIGRKSESGMWGRTDPMRVREGDVGVEAGWKAFTTDATCRALAWVVRTHPRYGRSVWLVADEDAAGLYSLLEDEGASTRSSELAGCSVAKIRCDLNQRAGSR